MDVPDSQSTAAQDSDGFPTFEDAFPADTEKERKPAGGLRGLLGENLHVPELDANTILLLLLVYFLVAEDGNEHLSDTLLIIGILLLLGF